MTVHVMEPELDQKTALKRRIYDRLRRRADFLADCGVMAVNYRHLRNKLGLEDVSITRFKRALTSMHFNAANEARVCLVRLKGDRSGRMVGLLVFPR